MALTLRDLPLPVKVVATVFLLAVGAGYTSAMVQLHMQDSKSGKPMPTVDDVIRKYTGKIKYDPANPPPPPVSRLEALIMCANEEISSQSMSGAFTIHDRAPGARQFGRASRGMQPDQIERMRAERAGEQLAVQLWIQAPDAQREAAYHADRFVPPVGKQPKILTPEFWNRTPAGDEIRIKSILTNRCVTCHSKGHEKEDIPLDTYEALAAFMKVEAAETGEWVKVEEPISITKLTQSTHAHLLSFAVLFSLTGVIFALSNYPVTLRCILGPWVVLAVFADVSLWWLARLSDQWGPYFAMGIIGTGIAAGAGLFGQIVLSLFNMYDARGKLVIGGLLLLAAVLLSLIWVNKIDPALKEKSAPVQKQQPDPPEKQNEPPKEKIEPKIEPPYKPLNHLDQLLTLPLRDESGEEIPLHLAPFDGGGTMVPAFFEKDKAYSKIKDDPDTPRIVKDKLRGEREAELEALRAWVRAPEEPRETAYEQDAFEPPPGVVDRIPTSFIKDGKLQIRSLIDARCASCHSPGKAQRDFPLTSYEELQEYLKPLDK